MSLALLAILVVIGVSLVVGLVHLSGGTTTAMIADKKAALDRYLIDFPYFEAPAVFMSADHRSALVLDERSGELGLVTALGANLVTRGPGFKVTSINQAASNRIEIDLDDLTLPKVVFVGEDQAGSEKIIKILKKAPGGH